MSQYKSATEIYFDLNDGTRIPALGLGTVPPEDKSQVKDQVITAVRAGYRLIDTAWFYGSEKYIGEALKELFEAKEIERKDLYITTKVWPSSWQNPENSIDESLQELGLEYVDLVLQHWPVCFQSSESGIPAIPKDENGNLLYADDPVAGTKFIDVYHKLEEIKDKTSKVKSIGVSNYSIPKLKQLLPQVKYVPVVNQIEYHPLLPQQDLVEFAEEHRILIEAYSPVGSTGAPVLKQPLIQSLAEKYKVTTNEIANAYHILQGRVAIPRSSNLERIRNNVRLPQISEEDLKDLYSLGVKNPTRYVNDIWGHGLGFKWWKGDTLSEAFD